MPNGKGAQRRRRQKLGLESKARRWAKCLFDALPILCERLKEVNAFRVTRANFYTADLWYHLNSSGNHFIAQKEDNLVTQYHPIFELYIIIANGSCYSVEFPPQFFDRIYQGIIPDYGNSFGPSVLRGDWQDDERRLQHKEMEEVYKPIIKTWLYETFQQRLAKKRTALIKEELVAAAWHPRRVERWIEQGVALEVL